MVNNRDSLSEGVAAQQQAGNLQQTENLKQATGQDRVKIDRVKIDRVEIDRVETDRVEIDQLGLGLSNPRDLRDPIDLRDLSGYPTQNQQTKAGLSQRDDEHGNPEHQDFAQTELALSEKNSLLSQKSHTTRSLKSTPQISVLPNRAKNGDRFLEEDISQFTSSHPLSVSNFNSTRTVNQDPPITVRPISAGSSRTATERSQLLNSQDGIHQSAQTQNSQISKDSTQPTPEKLRPLRSPKKTYLGSSSFLRTRFGIAVVLQITIMILTLTELAPINQLTSYIFSLFSLFSSYLIVTADLQPLGLSYRLSESFRALFLAKLSPKTLAISALCLSLLSDFAVFIGVFQYQFFRSGGFVALLIVINELLNRWVNLLFDSSDRQSNKLVRLVSESDAMFDELQVPASSIKPGDIVRFNHGDEVPVDVVVMRGAAEVSERYLPGVVVSKNKLTGSLIMAGTIVTSGSVTCRVVHEAKTSEWELFSALLERVVLQVTARDLKSLSWENAALVGAIFGAGIAAVATMMILNDLQQALINAAATLLLLPFAQICKIGAKARRVGIRKLFNEGIVFSDSSVFDELGECERFLIDYPENNSNLFRAEKFEILDDRVDEVTLRSVLISLVSQCDHEFFRALAIFVRQGQELISLRPVEELELTLDGESDLTADQLPGISAVIEGVRFFLGTEHYLISCGVNLQAQEVAGTADKLMFAVNEGPIAKIILSKEPWIAAHNLQEKLRGISVRSELCGVQDQDELDLVAKKAGFDLATVRGGVDDVQFGHKIASLYSKNFVLSDRFSRVFVSKNQAIKGVFYDANQVGSIDRSIRDLAGDVLFCSKSAILLYKACAVPKRIASVMGYAIAFALLLNIVLYMMILAGAVGLLASVILTWVATAAVATILIRVLRSGN